MQNREFLTPGEPVPEPRVPEAQVPKKVEVPRNLEDTRVMQHISTHKWKYFWAIMALTWTTVGLQLKEMEDAKKQTEEMRQKFGLDKQRPQPPMLSSDPKLRAFLEEHFDVIAGNASIEDARVVGLGEFHFRMKKGTDKEEQMIGFRSMTQLAKTLQKVAKAGDHVLIEGLNPERGVMRPSIMLHPSLAFIERRPGITVSGWDNEKLIAESDDATVRAKGRERNALALYPSIIQRTQSQKTGYIFVTSGVAHFTDDARIDDAMEKEKIPYILLGEKSAMQQARKIGMAK